MRTAADLFGNDAPDDVTVTVLTETDTVISLQIRWSAIAGATGYDIERQIGSDITTYSTAGDRHLENSYTKDANASGSLVYRVRAKKSGPAYTPWSPDVYYRFYGAGKVAAPDALRQEIAGIRPTRTDTQQVRDGVDGAVAQLWGTTGASGDPDGAVDLLAALPGLLMLAIAGYTGWRYGMTALGMGLGYTLLVMWLYAAAQLLGFPIVWPMALTLVGVLAGCGGLAKSLGWI